MSDPFNLFNRKKDSPKWPTFRKAKLTSPVIDQLRTLKGKTSFSTGTQTLHIKEGRMLSYGGELEEWPCVHFELGRWVRRTDGKSSPLYFLIQLGEYPNGVIWHIGPQYPHEKDFEVARVIETTCEIYREVVEILYANETVDVDVRNFLTAIELAGRHA